MAKTRRKKPVKILAIFKSLLVFVGKPFYYLFSFAVVSFLLTTYGLGYLISRIRPPKIKFLPNLKFTSLILAIVVPIFIFWLTVIRDLPSPKTLITREVEVSTKIYDRNGVLLYKIYKNKNRTPVLLSKIPLTVRQATLAAEDAEFYNHLGFSLRGITRAIITNLKKGEISGGSTITQQLVKNALLSPEKTLGRKIKEIILSIGVELAFSKDQIFEMYLNEVPYGGLAYGIQEASRLYFGKDVSDLTLPEAALLAGLPKSPSKYSPFGTNPELAFSRQREVLELMAINKYITPEEANEASDERITFAPNRTDIKAAHFVMFVRNALEEKYGNEVVEKGGLEVVTTLDYEIQKMAEAAVASEIEKLSAYRVGNGAAVVVNPQTGEILAMVGSKDYFDTEADGNVNVTISPRQPGSSIKIVNYAYALSHGYTPATILDDSPVTFSIPGLPPYTPKNYDGTFKGRLTLRSALAQSRNVPAVKVLASYGVGKMIELGNQMGISTWTNPSQYGLSLTLGGGEVKLTDLAISYSTLANYGKKPELSSIISVTNFKGKVLENLGCIKSGFIQTVSGAEAARPPCEGKEVLDPRVAFMLIDILKDNFSRAPAFGTNSSLVIPGHPEIAVKTGTSNEMRDNLTVGFDQKYLVAVWVGNNDNSPMARIASGITGAAPIWNRIMTGLVEKESSTVWTVPDGLVSKECRGKNEWFLKENVPANFCPPLQISPTPTPAPTSGQIL